MTTFRKEFKNFRAHQRFPSERPTKLYYLGPSN